MLNQDTVSTHGMAMLLAAIANAVVLRNGYILNDEWYWWLILTVPMLLIALMQMDESLK